MMNIRPSLASLLPLAFVAALLCAVAPSCSLQNVEGPDVTCASLECGRVNACENGIIAQCVDGKTLKFHVCTANADDVCGEDWQVPGQYKCLEFQTECEGCRPERKEGCAAFGGGGQSSTSSSSPGGGGAGGS